MLQSKMKWKFTYNDQQHSSDTTSIKGMSGVTKRLLEKRNLTDPEAIDRFLHPSLDDLHDPFLMEDMERAVERVQTAISNQEKILVFGDYDADGVSSTTVLMEALTEAGADCDFYIPNRFTEGYGPNEAAFSQAAGDGYTVIITVDTGIAAIPEADTAKELGIDLIITDHHEVQETLPAAYAIIHPKTSESYPFNELAGVGVAFKFATALLGRFPGHLLDMVAIGTIADLVPLQDENRVLVSYGLKAISRSNRRGIQALTKVAGIESEVDEETIGFTIGPRVNAVGRLQDAAPAVQLFLTEDAEEADRLAEFINQLNQERQKIVADIAKEAERMLRSGEQELSNVIVVAKEGWNPGVLGIVASKLVRTFERPAIVLAIDPESQQAKGSARSIDAYDLFANCMEVRDRFIHFGGHAQAAGMTLDVGQIDELRQQLSHLAQQKLTADDYQQVLDIEMSIEVGEVSLQQIEEVNKLRPFGMGNPKPLFHMKHSPKELRLIGSRKNHLKVLFQDNSARLDGIAFGMGDMYPHISPHAELEVVGELGINEWNGKKNAQIMVKDLQVQSWQLFDLRGSKHLEKHITLSEQETYAAVSFRQSSSTSVPFQLPIYNPADLAYLSKVDGLLLIDLPEKLSDLSDLIREVKPGKVYACYQVEDSAFLKTWPSRDHFKWFYGMLVKRETFHLAQDRDKLAARKGWDRSMIDFISKVFFELGFVKMEDGILTINSTPSHRDLTESILYQERKNQLYVEQSLYYSTYKELKSWFDTQRNSLREEVVNGL
ncbi:single-stranded-DNA-specific exonuclease RecJ [Halobacillus naozhouensis]|uniref:Single-stranded-DNA-specific exonuclease RecJ n=1 Tax=Halobacillus naozhouensis TaxID=554880 RepID=A0ABY8IVW3_9BACI|nr:single-stranded-DNA-specific exonuclease RecJ [Halobacillus naozhouensis]WFT73358.1 single-stranded-DNA-specific exonuclease RecJ [Halobacillus naozhouensis]